MKKKVIFITIIFIIALIVFQIKVFGIDIDSKAAVLIDFDSGKELYSKSQNEKMYPASLTKIMTSIIVVENCDLSEITVVSKNAINNVTSGYVTANLKEGEEIKIEDLVNILLIASSNDVANVLAEYVCGNNNSFIELMNTKAKEIGCTNTNFTNVNGTHDENHYSTAHDLALIGRYAMQNETIKNIISKTYYELENTNKYTGTKRVFSTTNELIMSGSLNYYRYAEGIKTGFTTPARTLLSFICRKK